MTLAGRRTPARRTGFAHRSGGVPDGATPAAGRKIYASSGVGPPVRRRYTALAVAALLLLAGCGGFGPGGDGATDPAASTDAPTTSGAPPTGGTQDTATTAEPTANCTPSGDLDTRPLPERPDAFTADSVPPYVAAYETATLYNEILDEELVSATVEVTNRTLVETTADGYIVHVTLDANATSCDTDVDPAELVTTNVTVTARYYVDDMRVVRAGPGVEGPVREVGEVLELWGGRTRTAN